LAASSPPPPLRRIAVIVNGNAKSVTDEVVSTLDHILDAGDLFISRSVEDGAKFAKTVIDRGYGTVLTGGGDGTFTNVVTQVVHEARARKVKPPRFGLLRLGTGNSLAWVVGASPAEGGGRSRGLAADVQRLRSDAGARPLRLVEVEDTLAPFCGFGVDANVLADFHRVRARFRRLPLSRYTQGGLSYIVSATTLTIPTYLLKPVPFMRITNVGADAIHVGENGQPVGAPIKAGEIIYEGKARMTSVSTIPYYGFGFRCFPFAEERADRMSLRISMVGSVEFVSNFPKIWRGEYANPESLFDYLVERVRVEVEPATPFQIGGDPVGERRSVEVAISHEPIELVDFYAPPRG
jgi:diacylglycerol kinase family enzyme